MVDTGSEDAWQRKAYISIESSATVKGQFESLTETIDIDMGERELDVVNLLNLGQIPKHGRIGVCTVTLEAYPLQAGTGDQTLGTAKGGVATGLFDVFASSPHVDTTGELDIDMSSTLTKYRVAILWTDQAALLETAASSSDAGTGSITVDDTPLTSDDYNGARIRITSGTAIGVDYMVTDTATGSFVTTTGDTPSSDGVSDNDSFSVYPTGSSAVITTGTKGMRFVLADCFCTSCKTDFTDGMLKQTMTFKGSIFAKNGTTPLVKMESTTSGTQLPALGNYVAGTTMWA